MKKKVFLMILIASLTACSTLKSMKSVSRVELSPFEKDMIGNDILIEEEMLLRKAILLDMENEEFDEDERYNIEFLQNEVIINFYLQKYIAKKMKIDETELYELYLSKNLVDIDFEEVRKELYQELARKKSDEIISDYSRELMEKYHINKTDGEI